MSEREFGPEQEVISALSEYRSLYGEMFGTPDRTRYFDRLYAVAEKVAALSPEFEQKLEKVVKELRSSSTTDSELSAQKQVMALETVLAEECQKYGIRLVEISEN